MSDFSPKAAAAWEHILRAERGVVQTKEPEGYLELASAGFLFKHPAVGDYDRFELTLKGRAHRHHALMVSADQPHADNERAVGEALGD